MPSPCKMVKDTNPARANVRYEADEKPPASLSLGLGFQLAALCISGIVFTPLIVIRAAGGTEPYLSWAVFAAVMISGLTTILQAVRVGRLGAGYVLLMGTSGAFIAVCITALAEGGPAMLATLVIISSLFQFALAVRLALFRRILTPAVTGTVIMLIAATVMPIVFDMLSDAPEGAPQLAAPVTALVTILVICGIALKAKGALRLWAPVIGVVVGTAVGGGYGLYDTARIGEAGWFGLPDGAWPGIDFTFGPAFWGLLPAFVFVTLIGAIETVGDAVAIQRVSWRRPRAVDFRTVQGAVAADGLGNLLSGLVGTVPNTTYSTSVAVTELTGVGARRVGMAAGGLFVILAFLPKALAAFLAIPSPVVAAYIAILLAMLFVVGMRIVIQDGVDYRKGLVVGIAFWAGVGFQNGVIFPEYFAEFAGGIFQNGMTAGGLTAIVLTLFMELAGRRPSRMEAAFDISVLPEIREFLVGFTSRSGWDRTMGDRLEAAAEETLLTLFDQGKAKGEQRRLRLTARKEGDEAVLEFVASAGEENLQDQMALLGEQTAMEPVEQEISLRLLRHVASSVRHQMYHDTDIVTVHVKDTLIKPASLSASRSRV